MKAEVEKLIRLLIVDEGLHKAEKITSAMRSAGIHVRAEYAEDSEDMGEMLTKKAFDLVLFSLDLPDLTLKQAKHLITECGKHVALVAMTQKLSPEVLVAAINIGAQDVVSTKNLAHLFLVVRREAHSLTLWREAKNLEMRLQESEMRCQSLLANSKDAVAYVHEGMHIYANQAYMELFGNLSFDEIEGTPIIDMVEANQQNALKTFLRELSQAQNKSNELDLKLIHSSGELLDAKLEFSPASYDGEPCTQILIRSASDTSALEEQINYLHQHDLVTGLFNRQHFMTELKTALSHAVNGKQQYAIIYITIDSFQSIRDRIGISGCDTLIGDIAKILQQGSADDDIIARLGADSYVCLSVVKERALVEEFAARIPVLVQENISEVGNQSISATCSTAVCFIDEISPENPNEMIARAEKTCEAVQVAGGNSSRTYVPVAGEMTQDEEDKQIATLIKDALANNRIKALYQPIVSIKAEAGERYISSLEVTTDEGNILLPADYQDAADRTGTARALDRWKVLHAIKKINEARDKSRKIYFFIPLSSDSLRDTNLTKWIAENLNKSKVPGEQLIFMVDEAIAVNQLKETKTLYKGLKQMRCQFALDDFGTGLNPFQLAKHVDADFVRISIAYMDNLVQNPENQNSIRELTTEAATMNIRAITPGVEDAAVLSVLWGLGVDFIQGDFLQPPEKQLNYDFTSLSG